MECWRKRQRTEYVLCTISRHGKGVYFVLTLSSVFRIDYILTPRAKYPLAKIRRKGVREFMPAEYSVHIHSVFVTYILILGVHARYGQYGVMKYRQGPLPRPLHRPQSSPVARPRSGVQANCEGRWIRHEAPPLYTNGGAGEASSESREAVGERVSEKRGEQLGGLDGTKRNDPRSRAAGTVTAAIW